MDNSMENYFLKLLVNAPRYDTEKGPRRSSLEGLA